MLESAQTKANKLYKDDIAKVKQNIESTADGKMVAEFNSEQDKEIALQQLNNIQHITGSTASKNNCHE